MTTKKEKEQLRELARHYRDMNETAIHLRERGINDLADRHESNMRGLLIAASALFGLFGPNTVRTLAAGEDEL